MALKVRQQLTEEGEKVKVADNLVVVSLVEGKYETSRERLADLVSGEIVGQISNLGMLQIKLKTNTKEDLDKAISALESDEAVGHAGYDLKLTLFKDNCPVKNDNYSLDAEYRCFYQDLEADVANTIIEELRGSLALFPVKLGIVDSGINWIDSEFADVTIADVTGKDGAYTSAMNDDDNGHGTIVAGMMVAADNGIGVSGLASDILGDKLTLLFGETGGLFSSLANLQRVVNAGADVVNMS